MRAAKWGPWIPIHGSQPKGFKARGYGWQVKYSGSCRTQTGHYASTYPFGRMWWANFSHIRLLAHHPFYTPAENVSADEYSPLREVLLRAFFQASAGKGIERHGNGKPFIDQPMQKLCDLYGDGFALGQAAKKMQEAQSLR